MKLFISSDIHWELRTGRRDTLRLAEEVCSRGDADDVLILAGDVARAGDILQRDDIAEDPGWEECFGLFDSFPGTKIACAGNHDIWDKNYFNEDYPTRESGPSMHIYEELWPRACEQAGWHCLDAGPLVAGDVAFVGCMGWYDYSFRDESRGWPMRAYERKIIPGNWSPVTNDVNYAKLGMSDPDFTTIQLELLEEQIECVEARCETIVAVTHHPCLKCMFDERNEMWTAISGSARIGELLLAHEKIELYIAGHTHEYSVRESRAQHVRCLNPASTYEKKNLLVTSV